MREQREQHIMLSKLTEEQRKLRNIIHSRNQSRRVRRERRAEVSKQDTVAQRRHRVSKEMKAAEENRRQNIVSQRQSDKETQKLEIETPVVGAQSKRKGNLEIEALMKIGFILNE